MIEIRFTCQCYREISFITVTYVINFILLDRQFYLLELIFLMLINYVHLKENCRRKIERKNLRKTIIINVIKTWRDNFIIYNIYNFIFIIYISFCNANLKKYKLINKFHFLYINFLFFFFLIARIL